MKQDKRIEELRQGPEQRREEIAIALIKQVSRPLERFIQKKYSDFWIDSREVRQEIIQEAYIRLMQKVEKTSFQLHTSLEKYFFGICKNALLERTRQKQKSLLIETVGEEPSETYYPEEEEIKLNFKLLEELLEKLGGSCQEVLRFKYFPILQDQKPRTSDEVAKHFGNTNGFIRKKISGCRKKLQKLLEQKLKKTE